METEAPKMPDCACGDTAIIHPRWEVDGVVTHPCTRGGCNCVDYIGIVGVVDTRTGERLSLTPAERAAIMASVNVAPGVPIPVDPDLTPTVPVVRETMEAVGDDPRYRAEIRAHLDGNGNK